MISRLWRCFILERQEVREELEIKLANQLSEIERFNQTFTEFGRRHSLAPKIMDDVNLAVEEILTNIISYGYTDNEEEHEIRVGLSVQPGEVRLMGKMTASRSIRSKRRSLAQHSWRKGPSADSESISCAN
ncbi:MAG: ATP-binding protein [Candidatus Binatia bacterium]